MSPGRRVLVWDLPTRVFHWALVTTLCTSWITAEAGFEWTEVHFISGYCALTLIAFRIVWGFIGPRHARFASFLSSPLNAGVSLRQALRGPHHGGTPPAGHSPHGGWAVMVMLALIAVQAGTGLFISDDIFYAGPYNSVVSSSLAGTLAQIHHINFSTIQAVVLLHLTAIVWYRWRHGYKLVTPMLHGYRDDIDANEGIAHSANVRALVVLALIALAVTALVQMAPAPAVDEYYF